MQLLCYAAGMVRPFKVTDTQLEVEHLLVDRDARMSPRERLQKVMNPSLGVRQLAALGHTVDGRRADAQVRGDRGDGQKGLAAERRLS